MTQLPIAHAGHWLADLLYVVPLLIAVGVLATQSWRDKRQEKAKAGIDKPADAPPAA
jgi:hypothetical protein